VQSYNTGSTTGDTIALPPNPTKPGSMAAPRRLGSGRILGSGRNLLPPSAPPRPGESHNRSSSLLSLGESVVSVDSQVSTPLGTSPLVENENEDLAGRVQQLNRRGMENGTAEARLVCPICNEEMVSAGCFTYHGPCAYSCWNMD
jgi:hypothetical protein